MSLDNLQTDLILRASQYEEDELLKKLGYQSTSDKTRQRLRNTLSNTDLGLDAANYDFRYSQPEFVLALGKVLGIPAERTEQYIQACQKRFKEIAESFKPFVWVDTEFKRTSEPVIALAVCEHRRYIRFPDTFYRHSLDTQLSLAGEKAALYYEQTGGTLPIWGEIKRFRYYVAEDDAYILNIKGEVIGRHHGPVDNKASSGGVGKAVISATEKQART